MRIGPVTAKKEVIILDVDDNLRIIKELNHEVARNR